MRYTSTFTCLKLVTLLPKCLSAFFLGALLSIIWVSFYSPPRGRRPTRGQTFPSPVLLVTAHPDDEAMFFAPILLRLKDSGATVDLLCLSTGDFEGLGDVRVDELTDCAERLGLREVRVISSNQFPDDPRVEWPQARIEEVVRTVASEFQSRSIITFDQYGVSLHPNHCAIARSLLNARLRVGPDQLPLPLFCLISFPVYRKYCALVDLILSIIVPTTGTIYVPFHLISTSYTAMLAHRSQLVWFRWLYVAFSVYMYKNSFIRV
ncbi:unnamed protein product [Echinostoma caproni]|uniref:N-acetylglucosaminylphosphatidylinositol deacetylase n=1 Tax=Echinostoma caproni TaxID=27848 RepID=A0A183ABD6_9TREM|nr:unnamed protein product [Echinostoma caproni]